MSDDIAEPLSFSVLTVNTHKGFSAFNRRFMLPELRDAVRDIGVDVVFLQEVLGNHERHSERYANWPAASQYEFLADSIWSAYAYGRNAVYPHGHHGNAILSKYPILHYENHDVSLGSKHERRGLLHCVLDLPHLRRQAHAICVHLGLREKDRREQLHELAALIKREVPDDAPLVVAGDFNDWRMKGHPLLAHISGMHEVFDLAHGRPARTFPARKPILPLDRIYVRNVKAKSARVLSHRPWSHLSDHAALMTEVRLR
ncbi:MAG: endonuclease/exonuclease/phosphatase family protein [Rhodocyclaceae bacterium]